MGSQRIAQVLLGLIVVLIVAGGTSTPVPQTPPRSDFRDWKLWLGVIEGMQAGEGYYQATNRLLREQDYALRPFVIWRLPTLATVSSIVGPRAMRITLIVLACIVTLAWTWEFGRQFGKWGLLGLFPALAWILLAYTQQAYLFHDAWIGPLIALSLWLHARNRWACIAVALLALLIREHTGPYVLVMLGFALWQRRTGETFAWLGCLAVFAAYMAFHAYMHAQYVSDGLLRPYSPSLGLSLLVETVQWTLMGTLGSRWLDAAVLALALLGAGFRMPRLFWILAAYFCLFMFTASAVNTYWGLIYTPLLTIGFVYSVPAVPELLRRTWRPQPVMTAAVTPQGQGQSSSPSVQ
jgi:hypothetical protein